MGILVRYGAYFIKALKKENLSWDLFSAISKNVVFFTCLHSRIAEKPHTIDRYRHVNKCVVWYLYYEV